MAVPFHASRITHLTLFNPFALPQVPLPVPSLRGEGFTRLGAVGGKPAPALLAERGEHERLVEEAVIYRHLSWIQGLPTLRIRVAPRPQAVVSGPLFGTIVKAGSALCSTAGVDAGTTSRSASLKSLRTTLMRSKDSSPCAGGRAARRSTVSVRLFGVRDSRDLRFAVHLLNRPARLTSAPVWSIPDFA